MPHRRRHPAVFAALLALAATAVGVACADAPPAPPVAPEPTPPVTLPLPALSGLAVVPGAGSGGRPDLFAVGDVDRDLLRLAWTDPPRPDQATRVGLPIPSSPSGSQLEAVAVAPGGAVLVLDEVRALVHELVLHAADDDTGVAGVARLVRTFALSVPADHPLGPSWADDPNRRGEGLALLAGGHLLVAKQRDPAALIEFGPPGATPVGVSRDTLAAGDLPPPGAPTTLVPLAHWPLSPEARARLGSLNDLAVDPAGDLYAVASRPAPTVARLRLPLDPAVARLDVDATWPVPTDASEQGSGSALITGLAEGLAFLPDGRALVAFDDVDEGPNLVVLPALE